VSELEIRRAAPEDAADVARIYNHYVATSTATFDTEERSVEDRAAWLAEHGDEHPVLVAERDGAMVGWGSLSRWGTRCAYKHTVEISVYISPDARSTGVGRALTDALVERARQAGHHAVIAQIVSENDASLSMSVKAGFETVGRLREVGRKFDRWLDVVLMERILEDVR